MNAAPCSGFLSYTKFCASNFTSLDHKLSVSCSGTRNLTYVTCLKYSSQACLGVCSSSTDRRNVLGGSFCRYPFGRRNVGGPTFSSVDTFTYDEAARESSAHVVEGKVGVLLLNLGGPETLNDVQPFLYNLFADPRPLAQLISVLRASKPKEGYAAIGGGSPLRKITDEQAHALKMGLKEKGLPANIYVGMRYWYPFTEEAIEHITRDEITRLVVLPLYP